MTKRKYKLGRLIAFGATTAFVLAGCGRVLTVSDDVVAPGGTINVTSTTEAECRNSDGPVLSEVQYAISYENDQRNPIYLPHTVSTESASNGTFEFSIVAPNIPGPYAILAICRLQPNVVFWQTFTVSQPDLEFTVSATEVEQGTEVTAIATWCRAENTYGFEDPASENPVMTFLLNGEVAAQIDATETNPIGTVDALIEISEVGMQEIEAICTYSAIEADFNALPPERPSVDDIREVLTGSEGELRQSVEVNSVAVGEPENPVDQTGNRTEEPEAPETGPSEPVEVGAAPVAKAPAFTG